MPSVGASVSGERLVRAEVFEVAEVVEQCEVVVQSPVVAAVAASLFLLVSSNGAILFEVVATFPGWQVPFDCTEF